MEICCSLTLSPYKSREDGRGTDGLQAVGLFRDIV
jgi:hypothetical protein